MTITPNCNFITLWPSRLWEAMQFKLLPNNNIIIIFIIISIIIIIIIIISDSGRRCSLDCRQTASDTNSTGCTWSVKIEKKLLLRFFSSLSQYNGQSKLRKKVPKLLLSPFSLSLYTMNRKQLWRMVQNMNLNSKLK